MNSPAVWVRAPERGAPKAVLGHEHAGVDCVSKALETLRWMIRPRSRALGADRLDRRGTRPGDPTLVASPRRVALHAAQRRRPRSVATSPLMSGEAAASASWTRSALDMQWITVTGSVTENVSTVCTPVRGAGRRCGPAGAGRTSRHDARHLQGEVAELFSR
jgi:hypothetical protein